MVIKNYKIALKDKSINLSIFYLLLLNVNMFIVLSGFGQTRLFGLGLSFIFSLMSLFLFLININKIPTRILSSYLMLLLYTLSIVIIGHDFYHWSISLFTLTAICLFSFVRLEEKDYLLMLFISSIFSLIVLISYTIFGFLSNWNPNSIGMFTTFGLLGFLIILHGSESNKYRLVSMIFIILSVYFIYLTESRNNVLIYIIALLSIIIHKILLNPLIYRIYYLLGLFSSMIIAKSFSLINDSLYLEYLLHFSYKYFGKATLLSDRNLFWKYIEYIIDNDWLFGKGESLYNIMYSHNMYYSIIYFFGIIGYILYILFIVTILEYIYNFAKNDKISMACTYIFIAICFGQITENSLFTSNLSIYFPYLYLSIAIFRTKYIKKVRIQKGGIHFE